MAFYGLPQIAEKSTKANFIVYHIIFVLKIIFYTEKRYENYASRQSIKKKKKESPPMLFHFNFQYNPNDKTINLQMFCDKNM